VFASYSGNPNYGGFHVTINATGCVRVVVGKNTGTTLGLDYLDFSGTTVISDGVLHNVVVTFRNNWLQVYIDGNLDISTYSFAPVYAGTTYIRAGAVNVSGTNVNFMNGTIDDLYLINGYALDERTIRVKYRAQSAQGTGSFTVTKHALITNVSTYSGGVTLITVYGGTDYSFLNATISNPYYSTMAEPFGFNANKDKWSICFRNSATITKTSPVTQTWYNTLDSSAPVGQIVVPIGSWNGYYQTVIYGTTTAAQSVCNLYCTLSDTNSTETDIGKTVLFGMIMGASGTWGLTLPMNKQISYNVSTKLTQYFNIKVGGTFANLSLGGGFVPLEIKLTSNYL
jgi:hypothetical protein